MAALPSFLQYLRKYFVSLLHSNYFKPSPVVRVLPTTDPDLPLDTGVTGGDLR